jgi:hypothetical protein
MLHPEYAAEKPWLSHTLQPSVCSPAFLRYHNPMCIAVHQVFCHSRSHDLSPFRLVADVRVERSCQKRRGKWLYKAVQPFVTRPAGETQPEECSGTTARWLAAAAPALRGAPAGRSAPARGLAAQPEAWASLAYGGRRGRGRENAPPAGVQCTFIRVKSLFSWKIRQQTWRCSGVGGLWGKSSPSVRPGSAVAVSCGSGVVQRH